MKIRDRIRELRRVPASELMPNPKNWRTHPKSQQDALRGVLAEVGMADAVLARELPDGSLMLIDGHLRAETAADAPVPVLILDVTEAEADKLLATLDPLAAMAEQDSEALAGLFASLQEQGDKLAELVWPDYIRDPLLSAEWKPPQDDGSNPYEKPSEDDSATTDERPQRTVVFTEDHWPVVMAAYEASDSNTLADFLYSLCKDAAK